LKTATPNAARSSIRPTLAVGLVVWVLYTALTVLIQSSSGIPYAEWFSTAAGAWRTGVLSLLAGSVLLLVFVGFTRWDHVWRDPFRLETTRVMKVAMVFWWLAIFIRLLGIRWTAVPLDLLLPIVISGILVGFAEETLFRGIFLRCLRQGGRPESTAAIWTAICFGLFHLPNVFMGMGAIGLFQVVIAALSGVVLYLFRRQGGLIWPAMVAHGAWDISTFLSGGYAMAWLQATNLAMLAVSIGLGAAVLVSIYRHDRRTVALPAAAEQAPTGL